MEIDLFHEVEDYLANCEFYSDREKGVRWHCQVSTFENGEGQATGLIEVSEYIRHNGSDEAESVSVLTEVIADHIGTKLNKWIGIDYQTAARMARENVSKLFQMKRHPSEIAKSLFCSPEPIDNGMIFFAQSMDLGKERSGYRISTLLHLNFFTTDEFVAFYDRFEAGVVKPEKITTH